MRHSTALLFVVAASVVAGGLTLDNGVARTPPMGWLSWQYAACNIDCINYPDSCINDKLYMDMADRLVSDGWKEKGYEYVNIDDCWAKMDRDANNIVVPDPVRFPNGIKGVCDHIHSKGLKCGLYTDIGTKTCAGYPGLNTANNMTQTQADIDLFVSWGIDSLKVDGCNADTATYPDTYPALSKVLVAASRPVLYSCSWPAYVSDHMTAEIYQSLQQHCNIWRNWDDISAKWSSISSIVGWWKDNQVMAQYAQPGAFNDPDMILAGSTALSVPQQELQFVMWSMWAAPLLLSSDLRTMDAASRALAQNEEVIAVNQDPLGKQGVIAIDNKDQQVWVRTLKDGAVAVALVNLHAGVPDYPVKMAFTLKQIGLGAGTYDIRDLLEKKDLAPLAGDAAFNTRVSSNSAMLLRITPASLWTVALTKLKHLRAISKIAE